MQIIKHRCELHKSSFYFNSPKSIFADDARKREQEIAIKERQELLQQIEEYKRLEAEQLEKMRRRNKNYQEDLVEQLKYERQLKDREIDEARREIQCLKV